MRVLGVFAKLPTPGRVKTRLASKTSAEWAARVADASLRDTLDRLAASTAQRVIVFAPAAGAAGYFAEAAAGRFSLEAQTDGDLGQRMSHFLADRLARGASAVVLVGADSPTLPPELIEQAFRALDGADVVLGPATDGGYYLLGCRRMIPELFKDIAWGTSDVLRQTAVALSAEPWRLALLPPWYDVDTLDDWRTLCGHIAAMRAAGIDPGLPRTEPLTRSEPWA